MDTTFSTPPSRTAAFEDFKQTRGLNLNKIYLENKEILASKKKQYAELARQINQAKTDIDKTRTDAERKKNERLNMGKSSYLFFHARKFDDVFTQVNFSMKMARRLSMKKNTN